MLENKNQFQRKLKVARSDAGAWNANINDNWRGGMNRGSLRVNTEVTIYAALVAERALFVLLLLLLRHTGEQMGVEPKIESAQKVESELNSRTAKYLYRI